MENKCPDIFTAFDLEMSQPSNKIIQIGYCVGNIKTGEILTSGGPIVNPREPLSEFIIKLTGITQAQVDAGTDLQIAYGELCMAHIKYGAHPSPITWGCGDMETLKRQVEEGGNQSKFIFGRRYFDAKTIFQARQLAKGEKLQGGLAKSLTKLGLAFKGKKHNAESDAINTFLILRRLLLEYKDEPTTKTT